MFRFGIDSHKGEIGGQSATFDIDSFSVSGRKKPANYTDNTKYFDLQKNHFVLNNLFNTIASKVSSAKFSSDDEKSILLEKINNPNEAQSKEEFLKEFTIFLLSCGWTAIWKKYVSIGNFKTMELINLNPDVTDIGNKSLTTEINGKTETILLIDVVMFYDSIRNTQTKKGISRVRPLRSQLENIKDAQTAKGIQIENSGTTIVSPKQSGAGNAIDEGLNAPVPQMGGGLKTQKEEMEERFSSRGLQNRIIVSSKGLDAKNLSAELNAVDFHKIVEPDLLMVYDAFNFPSELSPFGKNVTYDNKQVAEVSLIESEVMPIVKNIVNSLNAEFEGKDPIKVDFNHLNSMSIIQERIQKTNADTIDQYGKLLASNNITADEYKKILIDKKILQ